MALKLRLIAENPELLERFEIVEEQDNLKKGSSLYVKGPFIGCNQVNKNRRMYNLDETREEVNRYISEMVTPGRAMGELNHPSSAEVNLERACHLVTELYESDNAFFGKAKVLSTPMGQILRALINDGVKVGMSTRALGSLQEESSYNLVKNMKLVAIDAVADPSFPKAFVNGILESKQWVLDEHGAFSPAYEVLEKSLVSLPTKNKEQYLKEQILNFINALKTL
jgi:hypothetical protein